MVGAVLQVVLPAVAALEVHPAVVLQVLQVLLPVLLQVLQAQRLLVVFLLALLLAPAVAPAAACVALPWDSESPRGSDVANGLQLSGRWLLCWAMVWAVEFQCQA